jgi:hypothetical protein
MNQQETQSPQSFGLPLVGPHSLVAQPTCQCKQLASVLVGLEEISSQSYEGLLLKCNLWS